MKSFRDFVKMYSNNDGTRSLNESIAVPEVVEASKDWHSVCRNGVLIGGNAIGYHGKPRGTMDVDILFKSQADIPQSVEGFKKIRPSAFQHNKTHVEVETLHPSGINVHPDLVAKVHETATESNGVKIASPSGLVALKLQRLKKHDIGDIVAMIQTGKVDLFDFPLSEKNHKDFNFIKDNYS